MRFTVNRGADAPLEVLGLKGPCIIMGAAVAVTLIILAAILFNTPVPFIAVLILLVLLGTVLLGGIIRLNKRLGLYGLMKLFTRLRLPLFIRNRDDITKMIIKL
jgi:hypothetical protein